MNDNFFKKYFKILVLMADRGRKEREKEKKEKKFFDFY